MRRGRQIQVVRRENNAALWVFWFLTTAAAIAAFFFPLTGYNGDQFTTLPSKRLLGFYRNLPGANLPHTAIFALFNQRTGRRQSELLDHNPGGFTQTRLNWSPGPAPRRMSRLEQAATGYVYLVIYNMDTGISASLNISDDLPGLGGLAWHPTFGYRFSVKDGSEARIWSLGYPDLTLTDLTTIPGPAFSALNGLVFAKDRLFSVSSGFGSGPAIAEWDPVTGDFMWQRFIAGTPISLPPPFVYLGTNYSYILDPSTGDTNFRFGSITYDTGHDELVFTCVEQALRILCLIPLGSVGNPPPISGVDGFMKNYTNVTLYFSERAPAQPLQGVVYIN